jgi:pyruvate kinase
MSRRSTGDKGTVAVVSRRTKIIATIGPASEDPTVIRNMIDAGMDIARLGMAHDSLDTHIERFDRIRTVAEEAGRPIGILVDLPGPKVRAGRFGDDGAVLTEGDRISFVPGHGHSTASRIEVDYERLASDVEIGDRMMFGDGGIVVDVIDKDADQLIGRACNGGKLQGRPGIHIPSERLRISSPTDDDLVKLDAFVEKGVDMVALSFVRSAHDVRRAGVEPHPRGPLVVAKIETRAAVENLEGIIEASGAIMVARGDLGIECPIEEVPHLQKDIIRTCIALGRPAITATQMLESMVTASRPTRAEVTDVANAVFDGTSVVMLSGETAIGHDPALTVRTMANIAGRADMEFDYEGWAPHLTDLVHTESGHSDAVVTDTMTMAAWRVAAEIDADAILCISRTGFTVRAIARFRPRAKILGFSEEERTVAQLTMSWGATPIHLLTHGTNEAMVRSAISRARELGHVDAGDTVVVLAGSDDRSRATDVLRLVRVE